MAELLRQAARDQESTLEWSAALNCTLALTTAQAHGGAQSVEVTATTAAQVAVELATPWVTASPGVTYTGSMWLRFAASGRLPDVYIRYSSSTDNFLGDTLSQGSPAINTWTQVTVSALSPANTNAVRLMVTLFGMAAGEKFWLDDVSVSDPSGGGTAHTRTITRVISTHTG